LNTLLRLPKLTEQTLADGVEFLSALDPDLARIHATLGPPPLWAREPGFATLVHIILEQQVSLASAAAAFGKLKQASGEVTPLTYLSFTDEELKTIGFSRQKAAYCRGLARAILDGQLRLNELEQLDDDPARAALINVKGIGPWTADIYLLMVLLRPDSWPSGDLALAVAMQETKNLPSRPTPAELEQIAVAWKPWRAVAARMLWQAYLAKRNHAG
jgi:DNA-3-methyladenine glycosylase II